MITAIDTSVLLDVFLADAKFGPRSRDMLRRARSEGALVACEVVWAEVAGAFPSASDAARALEQLAVSLAAMSQSAALAAGAAWKLYRSAGGSRDRVVAGFLIGAHAQGSADRLLTRDRGFYRRYFGELPLLDPTFGQP